MEKNRVGPRFGPRIACRRIDLGVPIRDDVDNNNNSRGAEAPSSLATRRDLAFPRQTLLARSPFFFSFRIPTLSLSFFLPLKTQWSRYELPAPPNVMAARSVAELEAAIAGGLTTTSNDSTNASSSRLTVLEFYVPSCPACRSLAPKLRQLAADNPDVDFVTVNGEASAEMSSAVEALGVDRLPYFAVYRKGGERVSAFACNLRRVAVLRAEIAAAKECVGDCAAAE